jgi:hypothetical protein
MKSLLLMLATTGLATRSLGQTMQTPAELSLRLRSKPSRFRLTVPAEPDYNTL